MVQNQKREEDRGSMRFGNIINSLFPSIVFLLAVVYLLYSGLSISKAIALQNEVIVSFLKSLSETDILFSIIESLKIVFFKAVIPLLPFLFLISFGSLLLFSLKEKVDFKAFFIIQILFFVLVLFLSSFSIVILFVLIGILLSNILLLKTFEEKKNNFSTGNSLIFKCLGWMGIFIAIGLFLNMYVNLQAYQQAFFQSNMELVKNFVPDTNQLQKLQVQIVNKTIDDIKLSTSQKCQQNETIARDQCRAAYDSVIADIENYKQNVTEQINAQEISDEQLQSYLMESFPMLNQVVKASPLFLTLAFFALNEVLKSFISPLVGAIYLVVRKFI